MKATVNIGSRQWTLTLIPEGAVDREAVSALIRSMEGRPQMINFRGHSYMTPEVEFHVQPMPRGD